MKKVLVLDGDQRSALAATRALGRAGYYVVTASPQKASLAAASRFSRQSHYYPDPARDVSEALSAISAIIEQTHADLLMPMTDLTTHAILTSKAERLITTPSISAPLRLYDQASDKGRLIEIARRIGVPTPDTELIVSPTPLSRLPSGFSYPVVLKPVRSRIPIGNGYMSTAVRIARNATQFKMIQETDAWFTAAPWLLQSFIEGTGQGVFSIYDHGRPVAWFAHKRIREKPPSGGVSVLSVSALLAESLKTPAKKLLNVLNWHGPAMVEFRIAADGTPYLMEINARFWGSLQLAINAGVNFPVLAAQIALGEHPTETTAYRAGVYNRWLLGDFDSLYLTLKAMRTEYGLWQKTKAAGQFILPWWPGLHYEVNQWRDLGPFWHELRQYFRQAAS